MLMDQTEADAKRIAELEKQLAEAGEDRARARNEARQAREELKALRESVTEALGIAVKDEVLELGHAKEIAERLGVKPPVQEYTVTALVEVIVNGVDAEDEKDAEAKVRGAIDVSIHTYDVTFSDHDFTIESASAEVD